MYGIVEIYGDTRKHFIPVSEISHTKYNRPYWTLYKTNNTFITFKNTNLIRGLQKLQNKLEK